MMWADTSNLFPASVLSHRYVYRKPLARLIRSASGQQRISKKKNSIGDLSMGYIHIALSSHEEEMLQKDKTAGEGREGEDEKSGVRR